MPCTTMRATSLKVTVPDISLWSHIPFPKP
jgi:hypothetical protein